MTTLNEMIKIIRAENPNGLRVGDEENGYTPLTTEEYEVTILEWAKARLAKKEQLAELEAIENAKKDAIVKLTNLGIDPKVFGFQIDAAN